MPSRFIIVRTIHQKPRVYSKTYVMRLDNGSDQKFKETYQVNNDIVQVEGIYRSHSDAESMIEHLKTIIPDIPLKSKEGKASISYSIVTEMPEKPTPSIIQRDYVFEEEDDELAGDWESIPGMKTFDA